MDTTTPDFVHAGSLEELKDKARLVVHGRHRPVLLAYEDGGVFALDNRCPHMGFPAIATRAGISSLPPRGIWRPTLQPSARYCRWPTLPIG